MMLPPPGLKYPCVKIVLAWRAPASTAFGPLVEGGLIGIQ